MTGDGVMADGLHSYLEGAEARELSRKEINQKVTTAGSGGLTAEVDQHPVRVYTHPHQSKNVHRERLASSWSVLSRGLRSWVPEVETVWAGGDDARKDLLGAPQAPRLPASSREPSQQMHSL